MSHFTHAHTHTHTRTPHTHTHALTQSGNAVAQSLAEDDKRSSLSPEVNKLPPLERQFKKPPPVKSRRTPSKEHLKQMATTNSEPVEDMEGECVISE